MGGGTWAKLFRKSSPPDSNVQLGLRNTGLEFSEISFLFLIIWTVSTHFQTSDIHLSLFHLMHVTLRGSVKTKVIQFLVSFGAELKPRTYSTHLGTQTYPHLGFLDFHLSWVSIPSFPCFFKLVVEESSSVSSSLGKTWKTSRIGTIILTPDVL